MKNKKLNIWIALGVIFLFVYLAVFGCGGGIKGMRDMRFGIDIRGGVEAVFEPAGTKEKPTKAELEMAREVIETRLDAQSRRETSWNWSLPARVRKNLPMPRRNWQDRIWESTWMRR